MPEVPYHPQVQPIIDMMNGTAASATEPLTDAQRLATAREGYAGWLSMNGPGPEVSEVGDITIPGRDGPIPARVYRPTTDDNAPVVVFFHGGGMVIGSMDAFDGVCRSIADASGAVVVNVDYRLSPEHLPPAPMDDAWDAVCWVAQNAASLGASAEKLIVCGDSAGGNLAALCALRARDEGAPRLALQMLIYPVIDWAGTFPSMETNGVGNFLTQETMEWFRHEYLGDDDAGRKRWTDPAFSPWYAADLAGVCPAWVMTTSHDPLRDEGAAYAERLRDAGVSTTYINVEGIFHAFFGHTNLFELAVSALDDAAAAINAV